MSVQANRIAELGGYADKPGRNTMKEACRILESAISDVAYWSWWTANLPDAIQVEFGGVQLWNPPTQEGRPPSGQLALRFSEPSCLAFLRRDRPTEFPLTDDWHDKLHADEIGPFSVDHEAFTLTSPQRANEILRDATSRFVYHGELRDVHCGASVASFCAFWAGPVGLYLMAESMAVCSHHGDIAFDQIQSMSHRWWAYWREYWNKKDTDNPLPEDYACEVTIPLADESALPRDEREPE